MKFVEHMVGWILCFCMLSSLGAIVQSTTGQILFDVNEDGNAEAALSSSGLAIGQVTAQANVHVSGCAIISTQLTVGSPSMGSSNLQISGSYAIVPMLVSSDANIENSSVVLANTSSQSIRLRLPYSGNCEGRVVDIKKISASNNLFIEASGSSIHSFGAYVMPDSSATSLWPASRFVASGNTWHLLSQNGVAGEVGSSNLIMHYDFNESSGNIIIDEISGHTGSVADGSVLNQMTRSGIKENSLAFSGSGNHISLGQPSARPSTSFSFCIWMKFFSIGVDQKILRDYHWNSGNHYGYSIKLNSSNQFVLYSGNGSAGGGQFAKVSSADTDPLNWHHWCFNFDETTGTVYAYKDAQLITMSDNTVGVGIGFDASTEMNFSDPAAADSLNGELDDFRLYNRMLTVEEIRAIYYSGKAESL